MKIYFIITFLTFSYINKNIIFFAKYKFPVYSYYFHKISIQSSIKDKKMKDKKGKIIVYIKIIYKKPLLVPYTLKNIVPIIEG
jgi:hypothetical protein